MKKIGQKIKNFFIGKSKSILAIVGGVALVIAILGGAVKHIKLEDAITKESWKSTGYGAKQYMNNVSIDEDGKISSGMTAQDLWDKLIENGCRVDQYLSGPKELARLMKAEMVTKYPDLRENPDDKIEWEKIIEDPDAIQGIIKFIRADKNNKKTTMTYMKPEEFQSYIDKYNKTGDEKAKEEALKHFTLKKVSRGSSNGASGIPKVESLDGVLFIGDSLTHGLEIAHDKSYYFDEEHIEALKNTLYRAVPGIAAKYWLDHFEELPPVEDVNAVCVLLGVNQPDDHKSMQELIDKLAEKYKGKNIYIQRVFPVADFVKAVCGWSASEYVEHINKYNEAIKEYCSKVSNVYFIDTTKGYVLDNGYLDPDPKKVQPDGIHFNDYQTWVDNIMQQIVGDEQTVTSDGAMVDISESILQAIKDTPSPGAGWCLQWVDNVYQNAGLTYTRKPDAYQSYLANAISSDKNSIPVGAAVYGTGSGNQGPYGHVGIYIGNGQVVDNIGNIETQSLESWISWQENKPRNQYNVLKDVNGVEQHGWLGWGWPDGNKSRGGATGGTVGAEKGTINEVDGDGYTQEYTSSSGITYKEFKQGRGSYANNPYWEGTIGTDGCGPTSVAILASGLTNHNYTPADTAKSMMDRSGFTGQEPLKQEMDALGMECEIIESPSAEDIQDNLRNGKVMLVSVGAATIFTDNSHIVAILDINTEGQVYISNPGNTEKNGWYDVSEIMKDCGYIIITDSGKKGVANSGSGNGYVAVVATWKQVDTKVTTNDPNVKAYEKTNYSMTTTNINYEEMVNKYKMPFELLWAIMVTGEDKELVFDLTDLVYGSNLEITVYDNYTNNKEVNDWHYKQQRKAVVNGTISAMSNGKSANGFINNDVHDPDFVSGEYITTKTVVTQTNTIKTVLTRANVWYVDYKNDYEYVEPTETTSNSTNEVGETEYPDSPNRTGTSYSCEHIQNIINNLKSNVLSQISQSSPPSVKPNIDAPSLTPNKTPQENVTIIYNLSVQYYEKYIEIVDYINSVTNTQKYIEGVPEINEKIDEKTAPNFVTVFNDAKNISGKSSIMSAPDWLFEVIEKNDTTKDWLDLIKYLLSHVSGDENQFIEDFNFEEFFETFNPQDFVSNGGVSGGVSGISDIPGRIYDFFLSKGVPPVGAAAIVGNVWGESGFDPTVVNSIGCAGLFQWKDGRFDNLKALAASRGTDWTDVDTQLEHVWQELNTSYTGVRDFMMSATDESQLEEATWYWGRHFEVFFIGSWPSSKGQTAPRYEKAKEYYQLYLQNNNS